MLSSADRIKVDAYRRLIADVYELAAVSRRVSESVARQQGVTVTQWHTMSVLSGEAATVPQVASRLGVSRQAVQRVADQLVASGHLARLTNPRHETSPLFRLTPAGEEVLGRLWELSDAPRAAMLADVDPVQLRAAEETLRTLIVGLTGQPHS